MKDAVRVASMPNGSEWDFGSDIVKDAPFWVAHPQQNASQRAAVTPTEASLAGLACAGAARYNASATGRLADMFGLRSARGSMSLLFKPPDAPGLHHEQLPPEHILYSAGYFIQYGNVISEGWDNANPPTTLTHLLKASGIWLPTHELAYAQLSHITRIANMQAHGFWVPEINEARAAQRTLLFIKPSVVDAATRQANVTHLRELIMRGLHAGALTNRTLVLPQLACASPWVRRSNDSVHGISDARIILAGDVGAPRCYVGAHSYEFCWPWDHVVFAFDPIVQRREATAQHVAWDKGALLASRADAVVNHLPFMGIDATTEAEQSAIARVERKCHDYFAN
jgi:hypothetical protein